MSRLFAIFVAALFLCCGCAPSLFAQIAPLTEQPITVPPALIAAFTAPESVEIEKSALFDASESELVVDSKRTPLYRWNFGDGTPPVAGREVLHAYARSGEYAVRLRVTQGIDVSEVEKQIFVFDRQAVLVTDEAAETRLSQITAQAAEHGVRLTVVAAAAGETGFITEEQLLQQIQEHAADFAAADVILFYTRSSVGLQAFTRYYQTLATTDRFDPTQKLFVKISDENLDLAAKITQQAFRVITPRYILLTRPEALTPLFETADATTVIDTLTARGIEHQLIDERSDHVAYLLLSRLISSFVVAGVPSNIIYLLLAFPFAAAIVAFFRQVVGGATFGVYIPAMLAVSFLILGAPLGLFAFAVVLVVSSVIRLFFARVELLYIPRVALLFSTIALSLFVVIWGMLRFGSPVAVSLAVFPLLMMSTISEKFTSAQAEEGIKNALLSAGSTVAVAVVIFYFLAWTPVTNLVLSYPELVLVPLVATFALGRFTGLKLTEYVRFRALLREPGTEE